MSSSIDAEHLARQRDWSAATFGPGFRLGVIEHIRSELAEIEAAPLDLSEWVDVVILALDGAWRAGHTPQEIIDAIKAKQVRNEARTWPDWRDKPSSQSIEHDRTVPESSLIDLLMKPKRYPCPTGCRHDMDHGFCFVHRNMYARSEGEVCCP